MAVFLANTFSPLMLAPNTQAHIDEVTLEEVKEKLIVHKTRGDEVVSAVSHEVTARVLSAVLDQEVIFNRWNVKLTCGDTLIVMVPSFRAEVAREFTEEEVLSAPLRCFFVWCV